MVKKKETRRDASNGKRRERKDSPAISPAQKVLLIHHRDTINTPLLISILLLPQPFPPPLNLTRTLPFLPSQPLLPLLLLLKIIILRPNPFASSSSSENKLRFFWDFPESNGPISGSRGDEVFGSESGEGVGGVLVTEEGFEVGEGGEGEDGDGSV